MPAKLLLADGSSTIQRVIELTFAGEDVQVTTVGDGEQAVARVQSDRPDIVLADIGMPKRSGYDVAAFIKQTPALAHIPVLLLTGAFEPVDDVRVRQTGCDGVLVKPFEPRQVIDRVRELLNGAAGSPMRATANVPRPAERLAPKLAEAAPPRSGDAYFDHLDAAFAARAEVESPRRPPAPAVEATTIAEAFSALLAMEQGEPGARPVTLAAPLNQQTDAELVAEVSRRVTARVEHLVREELARIRHT